VGAATAVVASGGSAKTARSPVTVKVTWTDGTEGEVNGWTSQWTRTHVCVVRKSAPPYHPFWVRASDVRR
jgi:hypothetical protein